jgi:two-component system cell cycle response regulator
MRVLIADDDWLSARALETDLRASGYEVTLVGDGAEAWQILSEDGRPQVAILDWRMPIMDGLEVCRRVRQASGPYVYILLLTGNVDPDSVVIGMDAGADDYMRKPYDPAELRARLRSGKRIVDLEERLRRQATHDPLTGILNRGAIMERVAAEMARADRDGESLSLAMVDLDHFKEINDTYGHDAGDVVLREAALRMSSVLRPYDSIGRYGGEEFLVVFPKCEIASAVAIAERIRRSISNTTISTQTERILVTASIGIAEVRHPTDVNAVIREADGALFRAKQKGRDCVVSTLERMSTTAEEPPDVGTFLTKD